MKGFVNVAGTWALRSFKIEGEPGGRRDRGSDGGAGGWCWLHGTTIYHMIHTTRTHKEAKSDGIAPRRERQVQSEAGSAGKPLSRHKGGAVKEEAAWSRPKWPESGFF